MRVSQTGAAISGCYTWSDPKPAVAEDLRQALAAPGKGWDRFAPNHVTAGEALQAVMRDWGKDLEKIRGFKASADKHMFKIVPRHDTVEEGWELVEVTRKRKAGNSYARECACRWDERKSVIEVVDGYMNLRVANERFARYISMASGSDVGESLINLTRHLNGTCVRMGRGGLYYLPDEIVDDWYQIADIYESVSATVVDVSMVVMDTRTARAIKRGITKELTEAATKLTQDLADGVTRSDAIERRKERSLEIRAKAQMYEEILSSSLSEVHGILNIADQCAAAAIAIQDSSTVYANEDIFA